MSKATLSAYHRLVTDIQQGSFQPVYLLHGEESFFIDQLASLLIACVLKEEQRDFNQQIAYATDITWSHWLGLARSLPVAASHRLFVLRGWQVPPKKADEKLLLSYLERPSSTSVVVLCYHKQQRVMPASLVTAAKAYGCFESKPLYDNELLPWLQQYVKQEGLGITVEAGQLIIEHIGNDLTRIAREVQKMKSLVADQKIDAGAVERFVGISREYNLNELSKSLARRNFVQVWLIVGYFLQANTVTSELLMGSLFLFFSKLWQYQLLHRQLGELELAKQLGTHVYFLQQYKTAAREYSLSKIIANVQILQRYDLLFKGIGSYTTQQEGLIKELLYRLVY